MAREAWQATVHGVAKSWARLSSSHTHTHTVLSPGDACEKHSCTHLKKKKTNTETGQKATKKSPLKFSS